MAYQNPFQPSTPAPTSVLPQTNPPAPVSGGYKSPFASTPSTPAPTTPKTILPQAPSLGGYGAAPGPTDQMGKPFASVPVTIPQTFMSPATTIQQTDTTRVAPTIDPTKPQPITSAQLTNGRMPESVSQQLRSNFDAKSSQELDHIMPLELGGSNDTSNLRMENATNPTIPYNPSSNPTPTDPIENQIASKVRSGQISLLDGWRQMASAKGITITEDKYKQDPVSTWLENNPDTLEPLANLQNSIQTPINNFLKDPLGSIGKAATAFIKYTENPFPGPKQSIVSDLKSAASAAVNTYSQSVQNLATAGMASKAAFTSKDRPTSEKIASVVNTGTALANLFFAPILSAFSAAEQIPGLKQAADVVNVPFTATGNVGKFSADTFVNLLPVSQQTKDNLKPAFENAGSLVGQVLLGGGILKVLSDGGAEPSQAQIDKLANDAKTSDSQIQDTVTQGKPAVPAPTETAPAEGTPKPVLPQTPGYDSAKVNEFLTQQRQALAESQTKPRTLPTETAPAEANAKPVIPQAKPTGTNAPQELNHPELGKIELFNGRAASEGIKGYGMAKIQAEHPEVIPRLKELENAKIVEKLPQRTILETQGDKPMRAVVDHQLGDTPKTWLMNAYEKNVPQEGIEPPTQGSSNLRSTTELPRLNESIPQFPKELQPLVDEAKKYPNVQAFIDASHTLKPNELGVSNETLKSTIYKDVKAGDGEAGVTKALTDFYNQVKTEPKATELPPKTIYEYKPPEKALSPKPVEGTGKVKMRGLSEGVEAKAIENKLTDNFGDLPQYKTVNMADQAQKALDLIKDDPERARAVAMGTKAAPKDILPEAVFTAVENKAITDGDAQTLKDLANSKLTTEATTMGQRIRALGERDPESPTAAIQALQQAREDAAQAKLGDQSLADAKKDIVNTIKSNIESARPVKMDWNSFIDSIEC